MFHGRRIEGWLKVSLSRGLIKILLGNLPLSTVLQSASVGLRSYSESLISHPWSPGPGSPLQGFPILLRRSLAPARATGNKTRHDQNYKKKLLLPPLSYFSA